MRCALSASMARLTLSRRSANRNSFRISKEKLMKTVSMNMAARRVLAAGAALAFLVGTANAAGSGMPWEGPLDQILQSIEGPVARIAAVIVIIMTGLALAFGESSGGMRKLIQIVFGLSIAFAATSFFLAFFSFGGGAVLY
ncbi:TrbC/VirB2 family protein [Hyphococcus sp.]|uniref:TrbC/VirB2 family protein n=1 Tax=Hyphococcus sp. TaxID=2038636 RepID=UPI003D0AE05B